MAIKSAGNSSALLHGLRKPLLLTIKYVLQCSVVEYLTTLIHSSISDEKGTMQFLSSEVYVQKSVSLVTCSEYTLFKNMASPKCHKSYASATKVTLVPQSYRSARLQQCHKLRECHKSYRSATLGYISAKMGLQKCLYIQLSLSLSLSPSLSLSLSSTLFCHCTVAAFFCNNIVEGWGGVDL